MSVLAKLLLLFPYFSCLVLSTESASVAVQNIIKCETIWDNCSVKFCEVLYENSYDLCIERTRGLFSDSNNDESIVAKFAAVMKQKLGSNFVSGITVYKTFISKKWKLYQVVELLLKVHFDDKTIVSDALPFLNNFLTYEAWISYSSNPVIRVGEMLHAFAFFPEAEVIEALKYLTKKDFPKCTWTEILHMKKGLTESALTKLNGSLHTYDTEALNGICTSNLKTCTWNNLILFRIIRQNWFIGFDSDKKSALYIYGCNLFQIETLKFFYQDAIDSLTIRKMIRYDSSYASLQLVVEMKMKGVDINEAYRFLNSLPTYITKNQACALVLQMELHYTSFDELNNLLTLVNPYNSCNSFIHGIRVHSQFYLSYDYPLRAITSKLKEEESIRFYNLN